MSHGGGDEHRGRPEQEPVDDREDCRVGTDAERERDDDRGGEGGLCAKSAYCVADVLYPRVEPVVAHGSPRRVRVLVVETATHSEGFERVGAGIPDFTARRLT